MARPDRQDDLQGVRHVSGGPAAKDLVLDHGADRVPRVRGHHVAQHMAHGHIVQVGLGLLRQRGQDVVQRVSQREERHRVVQQLPDGSIPGPAEQAFVQSVPNGAIPKHRRPAWL